VITCSRQSTPAVGQALTGSELVAKLSFTGSTAIGKVRRGVGGEGRKRGRKGGGEEVGEEEGVGKEERDMRGQERGGGRQTREWEEARGKEGDQRG